MFTPQRSPPLTASRISGSVSPTTMPISVMPASRMVRITRHKTGSLAIGINCLARRYVSGSSRVPLPPDRMRPFMDVGVPAKPFLKNPGSVALQAAVHRGVGQHRADNMNVDALQQRLGLQGVLAAGL